MPGQHNPSDKELVERIKRSDENAFARLFTDYVLVLESYATRMLASEDVARDVVQNAFVVLWERRSTLQVRTTLRAYLFAAVRGYALMAMRKTRNELARNSELESFLNVPGFGTPQPGVAETAELAEFREAVNAVLASLSPRIQEVAQLRWVEDLSYAEIAEACGTSVKTVDNQLRTANRVLREKLGPDWE